MVWSKLATTATALGQTVIGSGTPPRDRLTRTWTETQHRLPDGWTLAGLRCASTGLAPEDRSGDWIAAAIGPSGEERTHQAADAVTALEGLAASFGSDAP